MLAKLIATATSSSTAVSAWMKATSACTAREAAAAPLAVPVSMTGRSHRAFGGGDELVPQRLEVGLGLDDVVADRRRRPHQLGMIGGRQCDHLAALFRPGLALRHQEIERPRYDLGADLIGGRHDDALEICRQPIEPALAQHGDAEDIG